MAVRGTFGTDARRRLSPISGGFMVTRIVAEAFPYDQFHDRYQEYYRNALKTDITLSGHEFVESSGAYSAALLRKLRTARHSHRLRHLLSNRVMPKLLDTLARLLSNGPVFGPCPSVGVYQFTIDERVDLRICIDPNDSPTISKDAAASSDI